MIIINGDYQHSTFLLDLFIILTVNKILYCSLLDYSTLDLTNTKIQVENKMK